MKLETKLLALVALTCLSFIQPSIVFAKNGGVGGGGGDDLAIEFIAVMRTALTEMNSVLPEMSQSLSQYNLSDLPSEVTVIVADEKLNVETKWGAQESVALNFPELSTIVVNRTRLIAIKDIKILKSIALHEALSLKKLEKTGVYLYSSKYYEAIGGHSEKSFKQNLESKGDVLLAKGININPNKNSDSLKELLLDIDTKTKLVCQQSLNKDEKTQKNLITSIGNIIVGIDIYRGSFLPDSKVRKQADSARDEMDFLQRELIKKVLGRTNYFDQSISDYCKQ